MKVKLIGLLKGCIEGRTMQVIPMCMGFLGSAYPKFGVDITDSTYVVVQMKILRRMGTTLLRLIDDKTPFLNCLHCVGKLVVPGAKDVPWPCKPCNRWIVHFPEEPAAWSFGGGYGGNALLCNKDSALRIASTMARGEGWLVEHCLILELASPRGEEYYIAAAFPECLRHD